MAPDSGKDTWTVESSGLARALVEDRTKSPAFFHGSGFASLSRCHGCYASGVLLAAHITSIDVHITSIDVHITSIDVHLSQYHHSREWIGRRSVFSSTSAMLRFKSTARRWLLGGVRSTGAMCLFQFVLVLYNSVVVKQSRSSLFTLEASLGCRVASLGCRVGS